MVPYEIGRNYREGGIVALGRDPGRDEVRLGRPFVGQAGYLLEDCLAERGIRRSELAILNVSRYQPRNNRFWAHNREQLADEIEHVQQTLAELRPNIIVAMGNEASFVATDGEWPAKDGTVFGATGIEQRRGFIFDGPFGKVLATIHPAYAARQWKPWRMLLSFDLGKAKEESHDGSLRRPRRKVEVVTSPRDIKRAVSTLRCAGRFACDIENFDSEQLACIGFADRADRAFVFPAEKLDECRSLLEDRTLTSIWQNGQYDLHFLDSRCGLTVANALEDTMLAWHAAYPELAGSSEESSAGKKKNKPSRKSLAFFASLATTDAWWKDYEFETEAERFELNGRDCCITLDVFDNYLMPLVRDLRTEEIYRHETRLIWPCVEMLTRGFKVDEELRTRRMDAIGGRLDENRGRLSDLVVPLIEERSDRLDGQRRLFERIEPTCRCCRHASKKQQHCWSCAGFTKAPSKKDLVQWILRGGQTNDFAADIHATKKADLEDEFLFPCQVCGAEPRREWLEFNPRSNDQTKIILYDILRLPKKWKTTMSKGKKTQVLTVDEEALKSLRAQVGNV